MMEKGMEGEVFRSDLSRWIAGMYWVTLSFCFR